MVGFEKGTCWGFKLEIAKLILDYLRVFLWPGVILTVVILQRKRLNALFERLTGWDIPGFGRIDLQPQSSQQPQQLVQEKTPEPPPNVPEPEQLEKLRKQAVDIHAAYKQLETQYANLYGAYQYETLWNGLYKSQIELMQFLNLQPNKMMLYQAGIPYFQRGTFFHGQKQQGYDGYIGFIVQAGVIQLVRDNSGAHWIQLTPRGIDFLQYMTARGLQLQMKIGM